MVSLGHSRNILQGLALFAYLSLICGNVMTVTSAIKFPCVGTKFLHVGSYIPNLVLISLRLLH